MIDSELGFSSQHKQPFGKLPLYCLGIAYFFPPLFAFDVA